MRCRQSVAIRYGSSSSSSINKQQQQHLLFSLHSALCVASNTCIIRVDWAMLWSERADPVWIVISTSAPLAVITRVFTDRLTRRLMDYAVSVNCEVSRTGFLCDRTWRMLTRVALRFVTCASVGAGPLRVGCFRARGEREVTREKTWTMQALKWRDRSIPRISWETPVWAITIAPFQIM